MSMPPLKFYVPDVPDVLVTVQRQGLHVPLKDVELQGPLSLVQYSSWSNPDPASFRTMIMRFVFRDAMKSEITAEFKVAENGEMHVRSPSTDARWGLFSELRDQALGSQKEKDDVHKKLAKLIQDTLYKPKALGGYVTKPDIVSAINNGMFEDFVGYTATLSPADGTIQLKKKVANWPTYASQYMGTFPSALDYPSKDDFEKDILSAIPKNMTVSFSSPPPPPQTYKKTGKMGGPLPHGQDVVDAFILNIQAQNQEMEKKYKRWKRDIVPLAFCVAEEEELKIAGESATESSMLFALGKTYRVMGRVPGTLDLYVQEVTHQKPPIPNVNGDAIEPGVLAKLVEDYKEAKLPLSMGAMVETSSPKASPNPCVEVAKTYLKPFFELNKEEEGESMWDETHSHDSKEAVFQWHYKSPRLTKIGKQAIYEIDLYADGCVSCSCPSWTWNKKAVRTCKHIEEMKEEIEVLRQKVLKGEPLEVEEETEEEEVVIKVKKTKSPAAPEDGPTRKLDWED